MSTDSQLEQFQKEFRENVNKKLDYLTEKIDSFPSMFTNQVEFNSLKHKVESLDAFKNRLLGIVVGVQCVLSIIGYLLIHFH